MKERLDVLLVQVNLASSREKAKALILAGSVYVDGKQTIKPSIMADSESNIIEVRGTTLKYVSRGGLKLEKAIESFGISLENKVCMDIGASTGGFTDCMLQNGAKKVYAVDVGHGQLSEKLLSDARVINLENTNFRYMVPADLPESPDFISIDVSFISLTKILAPAMELLNEDGELVCLIKPQFEAGREKVGKKGVVKQPKIHKEVIRTVIDEAECLGFAFLNMDFSPIKGPEGNIEYLLHIKKCAEHTLPKDKTEQISRLVEQAHKGLKQ